MIDLNILNNIMKEIRNNEDLMDSFSPNQFKSKLKLIKYIDKLNVLNKNSEIVIMGGWYGSILIPAFHNKVKKITLIDKDKKVISRAKYRLWSNIKNVEFIADDVFRTYRNQFSNTDLFINTSCEHMKPMREWGPSPEYKTPWWTRVKNNCHFVFQSNNMFDIFTHINCVNNFEEFEKQLPDNAKVLFRDTIKDDRGTRFMLGGKICNE